MIIKIIDTTNEIFHVNSHNIIYIKERSAYGLFKIALVNGENILTRDQAQVETLLKQLGG